MKVKEGGNGGVKNRNLSRRILITFGFTLFLSFMSLIALLAVFYDTTQSELDVRLTKT